MDSPKKQFADLVDMYRQIKKMKREEYALFNLSIDVGSDAAAVETEIKLEVLRHELSKLQAEFKTKMLQYNEAMTN